MYLSVKAIYTMISFMHTMYVTHIITKCMYLIILQIRSRDCVNSLLIVNFNVNYRTEIKQYPNITSFRLKIVFN